MNRLACYWPMLLGGGVLAWIALTVDWLQLREVMRSVRAWPLLPVLALLALGTYCACAVRWMAINRLPWRGRVLRDVYLYVTVAIALGMATPMQMGEALKLKYARDAGLSFKASVTSLALERVIDLAAIAALVGAGILHWTTGSRALAAAALAVPSLVILLPRLGRRWTLHCPPFAAKLGPPLPASGVAVVLAATYVKWGVTLAAWLTLLAAVDVALTIWQGMLLLGMTAVAAILSMVPAGLGVQEVSAMALLEAMGFPGWQAEAGALVLRLMLPVMLAIGCAHLLLLSRSPGSHG